MPSSHLVSNPPTTRPRSCAVLGSRVASHHRRRQSEAVLSPEAEEPSWEELSAASGKPTSSYLESQFVPRKMGTVVPVFWGVMSHFLRYLKSGPGIVESETFGHVSGSRLGSGPIAWLGRPRSLKEEQKYLNRWKTEHQHKQQETNSQ